MKTLKCPYCQTTHDADAGYCPACGRNSLFRRRGSKPVFGWVSLGPGKRLRGGKPRTSQEQDQ